MSKIVWDAVGDRYYHNGVSQGILFPQKADGTYDNGVAWNGLTGVDESPDGGDTNDLWADNIKYGSLRGAENFKGSISAYQYPDEFNACDGRVVTSSGIIIGQQKRQPFGFVYRTEIGNDTASGTDDGYIIHVVWNATVSPSDRSYETINDSPDAIEFSWDFETIPVAVTGITGVKHLSTMEFNSLKLTTAQMTALENKLFGTDGTGATDPTLPDPDTLYTTVSSAT